MNHIGFFILETVPPPILGTGVGASAWWGDIVSRRIFTIFLSLRAFFLSCLVIGVILLKKLYDGDRADLLVKISFGFGAGLLSRGVPAPFFIWWQ